MACPFPFTLRKIYIFSIINHWNTIFSRKIIWLANASMTNDIEDVGEVEVL